MLGMVAQSAPSLLSGVFDPAAARAILGVGTGGLYVGATIQGSTVDSTVIGGVTPAAGKFTTLNVTGSQLLLNSGNGIRIGTVAGTNPIIAIGPGAGGAANFATATWDVYVGALAGAACLGSNESTFIGTLSGNKVTSGAHNTYVGLNSGGHETTGSFNSGIGNDVFRNVVGIANCAANGKYAHGNHFGSNNVASGFQALRGNSSSVLIGGTATAGDTIQLTFTGTFTGSPVTVTSAAIAGGETVTQIAAKVITAVNANATLASAEINAGSDSISPGVVMLGGPWTSTVGYAITVTGAVTGAATETLAITGGSSGGVNIAIGTNAGLGYQWTTATRNTLLGNYAGANLTTGTDNFFVGSSAGAVTTTGVSNIGIGLNTLVLNTTATGNVCIGAGNGAALTTNGSNTIIGHGAGAHQTAAQGTFIGASSGANLVSGGNNTAVGSLSMGGAVGSTASGNVAVGTQALKAIASGGANNVVMGHATGGAITTGQHNLILGYNTCPTTLTTGGNNIVLATGNTTFDLAAATSNTLTIIGNSATAIISATATNTSAPVVLIPGTLQINSTIGFNGTSPVAKPTVTGSKGANAALASLMTALAAYGLVTDSTS